MRRKKKRKNGEMMMAKMIKSPMKNQKITFEEAVAVLEIPEKMQGKMKAIGKTYKSFQRHFSGTMFDMTHKERRNITHLRQIFLRQMLLVSDRFYIITFDKNSKDATGVMLPQNVEEGANGF